VEKKSPRRFAPPPLANVTSNAIILSAVEGWCLRLPTVMNRKAGAIGLTPSTLRPSCFIEPLRGHFFTRRLRSASAAHCLRRGVYNNDDRTLGLVNFEVCALLPAALAAWVNRPLPLSGRCNRHLHGGAAAPWTISDRQKFRCAVSRHNRRSWIKLRGWRASKLVVGVRSSLASPVFAPPACVG
jgi:hypothetical protein